VYVCILNRIIDLLYILFLSLLSLSLSGSLCLAKYYYFGEFVLVFARVCLPIPLLSERFIANRASAILLFHVNFTNVRSHITLDSKRRIAHGTRKRLLAGVRAGVNFERRGGNRADDDWSERFFVGRDREVRRCVFHAHSSEIEWNGS
jgi:hypothetical protein